MLSWSWDCGLLLLGGWHCLVCPFHKLYSYWLLAKSSTGHIQFYAPRHIVMNSLYSQFSYNWWYNFKCSYILYIALQKHMPILHISDLISGSGVPFLCIPILLRIVCEGGGKLPFLCISYLALFLGVNYLL